MSDFPTLKTGAVVQYPAQKSLGFSTDVLRFVDGAEQRFRNYQAPLRRWLIRVEMLDEAELHVLTDFFREQAGSAGSFAFTDPWDGNKYATCSMEADEMIEELLEDSEGKTILTVVENRG